MQFPFTHLVPCTGKGLLSLPSCLINAHAVTSANCGLYRGGVPKPYTFKALRAQRPQARSAVSPTREGAVLSTDGVTMARGTCNVLGQEKPCVMGGLPQPENRGPQGGAGLWHPRSLRHRARLSHPHPWAGRDRDQTPQDDWAQKRGENERNTEVRTTQELATFQTGLLCSDVKGTKAVCSVCYTAGRC